MPIAAETAYITKTDNVNITFIGLSGNKRSAGLSGFTNVPTTALVRGLASAYGLFSNAFVIAYSGAGEKREAPLSEVSIQDELYGIQTSSIWYFQNGALETKALRVYAPNAAYITNGVYVDMTEARAQAVRDAQLAILNNGLTLPGDAAAFWTFTGAVLDEASAEQRSTIVIPDSQTVEPVDGGAPAL